MEKGCYLARRVRTRNNRKHGQEVGVEISFEKQQRRSHVTENAVCRVGVYCAAVGRNAGGPLAPDKKRHTGVSAEHILHVTLCCIPAHQWVDAPLPPGQHHLCPRRALRGLHERVCKKTVKALIHLVNYLASSNIVSIPPRKIAYHLRRSFAAFQHGR